jgi:hypothetical protein
MKKPLVLFALSFFLAGCGEPPTPLAHALAAYRAADHQEFLVAKAEAQAALKTAIQPGDDLCFETALDVDKYGAVRIIEKLDKPDLFKANEETRFAYALNIVGMGVGVEPGSFLSQTPLGRDQYMESCAAKNGKATAAREAAAPAAEVEDEGRAVYMRDWRNDMKSQHGDAYDEKMRSAVSSLQNMGYSAVWPPATDLVE